MELALGLAAVTRPFKTYRGVRAGQRFDVYAEALLATALVLVASSVSMRAGVLWAGVRLTCAVAPRRRSPHKSHKKRDDLLG